MMPDPSQDSADFVLLTAAGKVAHTTPSLDAPEEIRPLPVYQPGDQPWYGKIPDDQPISAAECGKLLIDVVVLTAVERERNAVLRVLKPLEGQSFVRRVIKAGQTYYVGRLGEQRVVLSMCRMGYAGPGGALLTTSRAIGGWHPKAVIMVGIAFGRDPQEQNVGDVLVSEQVACYEIQAIGPGGEIEHWGDIAPCQRSVKE